MPTLMTTGMSPSPWTLRCDVTMLPREQLLSVTNETNLYIVIICNFDIYVLLL